MIIFRGMGVFKFFTVLSISCGIAWAVPASTRFFEEIQPDGNKLKVRNMGNEVYSYKVTEDGHAVVRNASGYFCYLNEDGSVSEIHAHDVSSRSFAEEDFLASQNQALIRKFVEDRQKTRKYPSHVMNRQAESLATASPAMRSMPSIDKNLNSGEKNALVVLVQFADLKFSYEDPQAEYEAYLNMEGYNENHSVGSVRDYFKENSSGKFIPNFTVVGPVTLKGSAYRDYGPKSKYGNDGARVALAEALDTLKARGTLDFKKFDNNGDYYLDFVHMIFAGVGSNDSPQDSALWPHMWYMSVPGETTQGVRKAVASSGSGFAKKTYYVDGYACSNELDGVSWSKDSSSNTKVGVGTFIHEFSHLLGLGDHYATGVDRDIYTLGYWDVMDLGAYNCPYQQYPISCAPPYYSAFERFYLGWMGSIPEVASGKGVKLSSIAENQALRVSNPKNKDEFYVLEHRQLAGWDVGLPNHGMLIWHIDYSDSIWFNALINTENGLHVDIVEADGKADYYSMPYDVFPGTSWTKKYTSFKNFVTKNGADLGVSLTKISEASDYSYVTFNVNDDGVESSSSIVSSSSSEEVSSSSQEVSSSSVAAESSCSSAIVSSSSQAKSSSSVVASSSSVTKEESSSSEPAVESSSSTDVESSSSGKQDESSSSKDEDAIIAGAFAPLFAVNVYGRDVQIAGVPAGATVAVLDLQGRVLFGGRIEGSSLNVAVPHPGTYLVRVDRQTRRVMVK